MKTVVVVTVTIAAVKTNCVTAFYCEVIGSGLTKILSHGDCVTSVRISARSEHCCCDCSGYDCCGENFCCVSGCVVPKLILICSNVTWSVYGHHGMIGSGSGSVTWNVLVNLQDWTLFSFG